MLPPARTETRLSGVVAHVDEWICEQCGEVYETEETALDCGWWDWVYSTVTATRLGDVSRVA
jgi:hypothetical protein